MCVCVFEWFVMLYRIIILIRQLHSANLFRLNMPIHRVQLSCLLSSFERKTPTYFHRTFRMPYNPFDSSGAFCRRHKKNSNKEIISPNLPCLQNLPRILLFTTFLCNSLLSLTSLFIKTRFVDLKSGFPAHSIIILLCSRVNCFCHLQFYP